jgi:hypothetical protein
VGIVVSHWLIRRGACRRRHASVVREGETERDGRGQ